MKKKKKKTLSRTPSRASLQTVAPVPKAFLELYKVFPERERTQSWCPGASADASRHALAGAADDLLTVFARGEF